MAIITSHLGARVIEVDKLTVGTITENLWPNANSEGEPPRGANTNSVEWAGRYQANAGAYAGSWVRRLNGAQNATSASGDEVPYTPTEVQLRLNRVRPCSPGESFVIQAQIKTITAPNPLAADGAGVYLKFYGDAGAQLDGSTVSSVLISAPQATYKQVWCKATAPANATNVVGLLYAGTTNGEIVAYYDAILFRRMTDQNSTVPFLWTTPTLAGYWVSYGSLGYTKDLQGRVTFRGAARASGPGATGTIFTLDEGYRPGVDSYFAVANSSGGTVIVFVAATGTVSITATAPSSQWLSLAAISFLAEN